MTRKDTPELHDQRPRRALQATVRASTAPQQGRKSHFFRGPANGAQVPVARLTRSPSSPSAASTASPRRDRGTACGCWPILGRAASRDRPDVSTQPDEMAPRDRALPVLTAAVGQGAAAGQPARQGTPAPKRESRHSAARPGAARCESVRRARQIHRWHRQPRQHPYKALRSSTRAGCADGAFREPAPAAGGAPARPIPTASFLARQVDISNTCSHS